MNKLGITIGSLFGILASVIGIIAIFFPDALNLQKNKIKRFEVEIDTRSDVEALDSFLQENTTKLVELHVSVCSGREQSQGTPRIETNQNSLRVYHDDCDANDGTMCTGDTYYFADYENDKANVWGWDKFGTCKNGTSDGISGVSGYFIIPSGPGFGQGNGEWLLEPIAAKDIALKEY